jgi:hypothetical protein
MVLSKSEKFAHSAYSGSRPSSPYVELGGHSDSESDTDDGQPLAYAGLLSGQSSAALGPHFLAASAEHTHGSTLPVYEITSLLGFSEGDADLLRAACFSEAHRSSREGTCTSPYSVCYCTCNAMLIGKTAAAVAHVMEIRKHEEGTYKKLGVPYPKEHGPHDPINFVDAKVRSLGLAREIVVCVVCGNLFHDLPVRLARDYRPGGDSNAPGLHTKCGVGKFPITLHLRNS